jgi:hypothetical protein
MKNETEMVSPPLKTRCLLYSTDHAGHFANIINASGARDSNQAVGMSEGKMDAKGYYCTGKGEGGIDFASE